MPDSSIDVVSPRAGTTQPYQLVVDVDFNNQSGANAWVYVTCSFQSSGGSHSVVSTGTVGAGPGQFAANFPHSSDQTNVSIGAYLTELSDGFGEQYASTAVGDLAISNTPPLKIDDRNTFDTGWEVAIDPTPVERVNPKLRVTVPANGPLVIKGTYDNTKGTTVGIALIGGKKKRPHLIYTTRDGEVAMDNPAVGKWTATIPEKAFKGQKPRAAEATLYDADRNFVSSDSVGLK